MIRSVWLSVILLLSWSAAGGSAAAVKTGPYQKILVLTTNRDETDRILLRTICRVFDTTKLNYLSLAAGSYEIERELRKLNNDDLLVFATGEWASIVCQPQIIEFIRGGGRLFCPVLGYGSPALLNMAGVDTVRAPETSIGFKLQTMLFPGLKNFTDGEEPMRSSYAPVVLEPGAEVLIASDNGSPLVWRYSFGKGKIILCDCDNFGDINFAGVLMQLVSTLNDYFVSTIFNAKVVFIDDFPFTIPLGGEFIIASNYDGRSYEEFYREIWWPQIKELAKKYHLKYTCLVLGNYENTVKMPPVPLSDRTKEFIRYYGKDLLKEGHELGIHGFNHASLLMADYEKALKEIGYTPWQSEKDMETSLQSLKSTLAETIGEHVYFTYVPPMNMLSKEGKKAVLEVFPSIKCIAGIGDSAIIEEGVLRQDIGPDPDYPAVYDLPRYSNGQVYREADMTTIYNYIACYGLFSHFIHPDDLMDAERSDNRSWKELYDGLEQMVANVSTKFPFLRGMTAQEFVEERFRTDPIKVYSHRQGKVITIEYVGGDGPLYHYVRLNDGSKIKTVENGSFQPIGTVAGLYFVAGQKSPVRVILE